MSRPREHNQQLAGVLLDAAERRIAADGVDALSLRAVAADAGTTTRAVYTLFGSKDALVGALGVRAMEYLGREVHALTASDDPVADVVAAGLVFRRFALEHPALYSVAFHRASAAVWPLFRDAACRGVRSASAVVRAAGSAWTTRGSDRGRCGVAVRCPVRGDRLDGATRQPAPARPGELLAQRCHRAGHRLHLATVPRSDPTPLRCERVGSILTADALTSSNPRHAAHGTSRTIALSEPGTVRSRVEGAATARPD